MGVRTGNPRGRPKGAPNKATAAKCAAIEASGLTPLDYMLALMRDEENPAAVRLDAAKSAAPYVHPRLATTALVGGGEGSPPIDLLTRIERIVVDPSNPDAPRVPPAT